MKKIQKRQEKRDAGRNCLIHGDKSAGGGLVILRVPKAGAVRAAEASQLCTEETAAVQVETASGSEGEKRETAME